MKKIHAHNPLKALQIHKTAIDSYSQELLKSAKSRYSHHPESKLLFKYLQKFLPAGKTFRGGLFLEAISLLNQNQTKLPTKKKLLATAAALELFHSALLIQDDYMDQDTTRRGQPALHHHLLKQAEQKKSSDPNRLSISGMICASDILFFLAFRELSKLDSEQVTTFLSEEYIEVGFSQWHEVSLGLLPQATHTASLKDIQTIYKYKTARYTFVLPFLAAGILTNLSPANMALLETATENLGMLYQITDDRLNIFGSSKETGKPVGSDISENKHSLYAFYLRQALNSKSFPNHKKVIQLFGKKNLTPNQLKEVQTALKETGTVSKIESHLKTHQEAITASVKHSTLPAASKDLLLDLTRIVVNRTA